MLLIGLCGRSGSGKSVFSDMAKSRGYVVVDCDKVYHELVSFPSDCLRDIGDRFGQEFIKNGSLDRPALAKKVFSDTKLLRELNRITHGHIINRIEEILGAQHEDARVLLDAPTLFESGLDRRCSYVVGIVSDDKSCVQRLVLRDGISEEAAKARLQNQPSIEFIAENSDYIIYNDGNLQEFASSSKSFFDHIEGELL